MDMGFEQQVRERAYEIWKAAGMTDGMALEHWCAAEDALRAKGEVKTSATKAKGTAAKAAKRPTAKRTAAKSAVAKAAATNRAAPKAVAFVN